MRVTGFFFWSAALSMKVRACALAAAASGRGDLGPVAAGARGDLGVMTALAASLADSVSFLATAGDTAFLAAGGDASLVASFLTGLGEAFFAATGDASPSLASNAAPQPSQNLASSLDTPHYKEAEKKKSETRSQN